MDWPVFFLNCSAKAIASNVRIRDKVGEERILQFEDPVLFSLIPFQQIGEILQDFVPIAGTEMDSRCCRLSISIRQSAA